MKTYKPSSLQDIKKMFANEHVQVLESLFGTKYIDKHTGKEIPKTEALRILAGFY